MPEPRKAVQTRRHNEEPGNPKRTPARTQQRMTLREEIAKFQLAKRSTKVALRGNHVACLLIMFCYRRLAMPFSRRVNVRHATLLFCAECGEPWSTRAREKEGIVV